VRFELTEGSHLRRFSRPVHSTTLPRFQLNSTNIVMRLLRAFASGLRQKQRLQIAQEIKAALGGHHALKVACDETFGFGLGQGRLNSGHGQARAIGEVGQRKAMAQAQGVEHELKRQLGTRHLGALSHGTVCAVGV
jgi:hypothetical protein